MKVKRIIKLIFAFLFCAAAPVFAASGGIDATGRYAWTENAGWLDFGVSAGNVPVGDSPVFLRAADAAK